MHLEHMPPPDRNGEILLRWRHLLALLTLVATSLTAVAANLRLAGPGTSWENVTILTNSVTCDALLSETGHKIHATSGSDSALALFPDWNAWRDVPDARLEIWIEAVTDSSNVVSVLLGNLDTPSLVLSCADDWSIQPAGAAPVEPPAPAAFGIATQSLHLVIYPGRSFGQGVSFTESRIADSVWTPRPDLTLTAFGWHDPEQAIPNWTQVGVSLAGPEAALLSLRMRWAPDATIMIFR
jgi:hypothetical protein